MEHARSDDSFLDPSGAQAQQPCVRAQTAIRKLLLHDFRSYPTLNLNISADLVVLTGENGAGKTNVLEAISLLTPGRGLRRADLSRCIRENASGGFAVSAEIEGALGTAHLGTGIESALNGGPVSPRKYRIDREPVGSARAFADHLRIVWLTPAMDGLFAGPPGERRRFLDRLVLAVDADHGSRTNALEKALRNRNRLLESGTRDEAWLGAAEREVAELGVAVTAARLETVERLGALMEARREDGSPFPWADIAMAGEIDRLVADAPALEAEEQYRAILRDNRWRDAAAGRTLVGPQASDLEVAHGPKQTAAALCSTGEQKALLIGLILAHARLVATMSGITPLVLLDEIAAHLDPRRRAALFEYLRALGTQVWVTGADPAAFAEIAGPDTEILQVTPGKIASQSAV